MKLTKTLFFAALTAGGLLASAHAQNATTNTPAAMPSTNMPPHMMMMRGGAMVDRIAKALDLTDAEKAQVAPIINSEMQQMRATHMLPPDQRAAKSQAIREQTDKQLQAVLTPDQFTKWQGMHTHPHPMAPQANTNSPAAAPTATPPPASSTQ